MTRGSFNSAASASSRVLPNIREEINFRLSTGLTRTVLPTRCQSPTFRRTQQSRYNTELEQPSISAGSLSFLRRDSPRERYRLG